MDLSKEVTAASILIDDFDVSSIEKSVVDLSLLKLDHYLVGEKSNQVVAFLLKNIFTREECQALISLAEQRAFSKVPVNIGGNEVVIEAVRSGSRVLIDDEEFVQKLWSRISYFIPKKLKGAEVVGLNERLRFLKYLPGQFFAPHTDGCYARPENSLEVSLLTIQMYLNEGFEGGETSFLLNSTRKNHQRVPIKPETGMALVFAQDLKHEGSLLKNGVKYTVRTDVMYRYGSL